MDEWFKTKKDSLNNSGVRSRRKLSSRLESFEDPVEHPLETFPFVLKRMCYSQGRDTLLQFSHAHLV